MQLSSKLVSAVFPEFHGVASFMVYTLHPTTFYQSGVSQKSDDCSRAVLFNFDKCTRVSFISNYSQNLFEM